MPAKINFQLFTADCLDIMSRIEDETFNLVYLDPPWNTTQDSVFYATPNENNYEEFIFKVLQQAKRILRHNGNLMFHSVPALNVNFHNLLKPIFGDKNFRAEFIIPIKRPNIRAKAFRHNHETILHYSKSDAFQFFPWVEKSQKEINELFPWKEAQGNYKLESLLIRGERPDLNFEWKGFLPRQNMVWRFSKQRLNELESDGRILYSKEMDFPKLKRYANENLPEFISSIWQDAEPYDKSIYGRASQQSESLLTKIINISTAPGDAVCDPFCGTGTSGVVCSKLGRSWLGIEKDKQAEETIKDRFRKLKANLSVQNKEEWGPVLFNNYFPFSASKSEIARTIINKGENERVEFKESYIFSHYDGRRNNQLPEKVMKEIAAFLNSKYGGSIFLGVDDNGGIRGLERDILELNGDRDSLELSIISKIKSCFGGISADLIQLISHSIESKIVCEIQVSPYKNPVFLNGDFYIRIGTQAATYKNEEFFDLIKQRKLK